MTEELDDITCRELVELVTDFLEGALAGADLGRFEAHLEICDECRDYVEQMRATAELTGGLDPNALDPPARDALLATFRDWKQERT